MFLSQVEFYNSPDGEVMIKMPEKPVRKLEKEDRELIQELFITIRDRFPIAFKRLSELYSKNERDRWYFEYKIVHRFIRCNFGEYDQYKYDIDRNGYFQFEEVKCPLRGECVHEEVICKPQLNTKLSSREVEILHMIADGMQALEIANNLNISVATVNRHRENIKAKMNVRTISQMVNFYNLNLRQ